MSVSPTAKFPGGYSASDPGIFTPKIFDGGFKYSFPGPAMPKFSSSGAASVKTSNNSSSTNANVQSNTNSGSVKSKCRRAISGWTSRMEKRFIGAPAAAPAAQ